MWRYLLPVALFIALIVFFWVGLGRDKETLPSPLVGKPAPRFELPSVDDPAKRVATRDFAGKPYVLNVWGSWCVGCRQEHDALIEISRRNEVPLVGLNWRDELPQAQAWLSQLGDPYVASAHDAEGRTAIDWGVYGAPETFLVDAAGNIVHKHIGPLTIRIWESDFVPLLDRAGATRE